MFSKRLSIHTATNCLTFPRRPGFTATVQTQSDPLPKGCHVCLSSSSVMHDECVTCAKKCAVAMGANQVSNPVISVHNQCMVSNTALHITYLSYYIPFTGKHEPNKLTCSQLCDFVAHLVRALHRHRRGHGFIFMGSYS